MRQNIEIRLVDFAVAVINLSKNLKKDTTSKLLSEQIVRSATSTALNYGEAQNAQSKKDFIHKSSIVLKELRETHINLQLIFKTNLFLEEHKISDLLKENDELLAIFTASIITATKNLRRSE